MARDYRGNLKWRSGKVVERTGPLMYKIGVASDSQAEPTTPEFEDENIPETLTPVTTSSEQRYPERVRKPPARLDL